MEFTKAFTFVFDDPDWLKKVAINALIGLIPIVGALYLFGWGLEVARRVAVRSAVVLPDVDFGTFLGHGFKAFVVSIVYAIPVFIITLPIVAIAAIAEGARIDTDALYTVVAISNVCGGLLGVAYGLLMGLLIPAALTRTVVRGSIGAGLQIGAVFGMVKSAPGAYILTLLGTMVAGFLAALVGTLACGIGIVFTAAYQQAVTGHLYGQAYLQSD
jgi:hypothetical protein